MVRRYLAWKGWDVRFVRNITDVDDKIIAIAQQEGVPPGEHAVRITEEFDRGYRDLGCGGSRHRAEGDRAHP